MATLNPILQQMIKEIAGKASTGRTDITWGTLSEGRRKKIKEGVPAPKKNPADEPTDEDPNLPPSPQEAPEQAPSQEAPTSDAPDASPEQSAPDVAPEAPDASAEPQPDAGEDVDAAKEDAGKAQAELQKAKAEKDQAEQELEDQSYVKLDSPSGVSFLLGKLISHAFQTNTIDALAGEFVNKLAISTPEDIQQFSTDMIPYKNIPGMAEFLDSAKGLVSQSGGKEDPSND